MWNGFLIEIRLKFARIVKGCIKTDLNKIIKVITITLYIADKSLEMLKTTVSK